MSDDPVSAEEIAHRRFSYAFRGFDPGEVRDYLDRVAAELRTSIKRERDLQRQLKDAEHRAAHPVIDEEVLTQSLGEETSRILASAHDVARELRTKAEENAARILREAHAEAQRTRASAEVVLAERSEEAEKAAEEIRQAASTEAQSSVAKARQDAQGVLAQAEQQAARMVAEAEAASARVMKEMSRRRRIAHAQVEQLLAGRERLLEAYRLVRRTLEEVGDELRRAEPEAREASEAVARRTGTDPELLQDAGPDEDEAPPAGAVSVAADTALSLARRMPDEHEDSEPEDARAAASRDVAPEPEPEVTGDLTTAPEAEGEPEERGPTEPVPAPDLGSPTAADVAGEAEPAPEREAGLADAPTGPDPESGPPSEARAAVAELFARIKAGRSEAVAQAEALLADAAEEAANGSTARDGGRAAATEAPEEPAQEDHDRAILERRDAAIADITARLARMLKRALQDEQNEVLDRLRSHRGRPSAGLLPAAADHAARYRRTSTESLEEAARAGAAFAAPDASLQIDVGEDAAGLADALASPLRRRLEAALEAAGDDDPTATADRVSATYREWKVQQVERLAGDAVISAFSRAVTDVSPGAPLRWVVDDDGGPCPDCYDNALAGPTPGGQSYPTGQGHPPAHPGCRCVLVPVT